MSFLRIILLLFCCLTTPLLAQSEADYTSALAGYLGGQTEVSVRDGRVDIVTDTHAIEVERARKWKEAIGQALWYGLQTNRRPGIILIKEAAGDYIYGIELGSTLTYGQLSDRIDVWVWPDDFPGVVPAAPSTYGNQPAAVTDYWLNLNGKKRHRRGCRWFANTARGRYCTAEEGTGAGCCY